MENNFENLITKVFGWASDKGILTRENATKQMLKVMEEVGETAGALAKGKEAEIKDGIGDAFVTLIILSFQLGLDPTDCLETAWNEIKDRKGKTIGGVFVKE
jgi:NTP pyrophosphatase (non-canonical NTP hydrolase)